MGVVSSGLGQERSVSVVNEMSSRGKKGLSRVGLGQLLGIHKCSEVSCHLRGSGMRDEF
jgi:hypothetical protein